MNRTGTRLRRLDLAATGSDPAAAALRQALVRRGAAPDRRVRDDVRAILDDVRDRGEPAVRDANARFGGGLADGRLVIDQPELATARDRLAPSTRAALDLAITNVKRFAESQRPVSSTTIISAGIEIERRWTPISCAGAYVPGGSAVYPSTMVMTMVPARVAGVQRMVVATPADTDGVVHPVTLGAAGLLGVDAVVVAGGAQAIGALAYGLAESRIDPVDRVVGPGNAWVTAAKLEVAGDVGIDALAGPSEGLVLAAPPADPFRVALDVVTQAEHGPDSPALLVTIDEAFADEVEAEIDTLLMTSARRAVLERSLGEHGCVVIAPDLDRAIDFVNHYAPEHLSVDVAPLETTVARIRNAGSLFVGPWAPESAGDYATGANHVLPTGGSARWSGALSVESFGKYTQVQRVTRDGLASIRDAIEVLATAEGLLAHRDAVARRFEREPAP